MPRPRRPIKGLLALLTLLSLTAAGCSNASTRYRIRQLDAHEKELRASVQSLETKQDVLRQEIQRAEVEAAGARCRAEQEKYRAVVAAIVAEYAIKVADHKSCRAESAKGGGAVMAAGCGLAAFLTGGLALAVCGGAFVAGAVISEASCSDAPPLMRPEDVQARAQQETGQPREPMCDGSAALAMNQRPAGQRSSSPALWDGTEARGDREPPRVLVGVGGFHAGRAATPTTAKERRKAKRAAKRARRKADKRAAKERRRRR